MLEWIVTSCALILIVIALRYLLRGRISLRLQYALWALVLVRLLVPISFGPSPISVMNAVPAEPRMVENAKLEGEQPAAPAVSTPKPQSGSAAAPGETAIPVPVIPGAIGGNNGSTGGNGNIGDNGSIGDIGSIGGNGSIGDNGASAPFDLKKALAAVWLAGAAAVLASFAACNIRMAIRLKKSRRRLENVGCELPVYISDALETPCLFGLFRPAIYVTSEAAADEVGLRHVIAHECAHAKHFDHVFSALRGLCLALHWYDPLVWLAAVLSKRDQELACDEAAIARIGEAERAEYGKTLIGMTCRRPSGLLTAATTMTASRGSIKERVALIAKKPRMTGLMLTAVLAAAAIAIGCTFTGASKPREASGDGEKQAAAPTSAPSEAPTTAPTGAPPPAPTDDPSAPKHEKLSVPVYSDYELLLANNFAPLGRDGCAKRGSDIRTGINDLLFTFPTDALRKASSGEEYLIFDSERGYREYVFIDRSNDAKPVQKGFPLVIGRLQPYSAFGQLKLGDPIEAVERIDPVAALHRQIILEMRQIHPATAKKYCVGYNALASLHYLTDGILKIEYEMPAEGELVISNIIYSPEHTLKHFFDTEVCYRIEPIDLPERSAEPGEIEHLRRYNERELAMMSEFLDTVDAEGRTNGSKLSAEYASGRPETWGPYAIHWLVYAGERHIYSISLDGVNLVGKLDVSRFPVLETLGCTETRLDSINASHCPMLTDLICAGNRLAELGITGCTRLEHVDCRENSLSSVDCTLCPMLDIKADAGVELIGF